ncbi:UBP-type zinc finger domain-containing protein [Kitasatospora sp. NPDC096147]|uniref:UBP-type zinc finger domain-containing protein n=1 Tax=Kitasatospora sp. NPDC096147 TaxID=3364093 RepID=UPI003814AA09
MSEEQQWQVAVDRGLVVQRTCDHLDGLPLAAPSPGGPPPEDGPERPGDAPPACEDCLREGTTWVHLRACLSCGRIGCCDSSPGRHAHRHARSVAGHHVARSAEPGEAWAWCYTDELYLHPA